MTGGCDFHPTAHGDCVHCLGRGLVLARRERDLAIEQLGDAWRHAHMLATAIGQHRERMMSLGQTLDRKGNPVHGTEWDRELWSVLTLAEGSKEGGDR